jgi:hypothetical protein
MRCYHGLYLKNGINSDSCLDDAKALLTSTDTVGLTGAFVRTKRIRIRVASEFQY